MSQLAVVGALQAAPRGPWAPRTCQAAAAAGAACAWPAHAPPARLPAGSRSRGSLTWLRVAYQQAPSSTDTDEDADYYKVRLGAQLSLPRSPSCCPRAPPCTPLPGPTPVLT